jgi:hypothetical protein
VLPLLVSMLPTAEQVTARSQEKGEREAPLSDLEMLVLDGLLRVAPTPFALAKLVPASLRLWAGHAKGGVQVLKMSRYCTTTVLPLY